MAAAECRRRGKNQSSGLPPYVWQWIPALLFLTGFPGKVSESFEIVQFVCLYHDIFPRCFGEAELNHSIHEVFSFD